MSEWTVGVVLDAITDAVPDRTMTLCGARRSTFADGNQHYKWAKQQAAQQVPSS